MFSRRRIGLLRLERLDKLMRYDPETGYFISLNKDTCGRHYGAVFGKRVRPGDNLYIEICIDNNMYRAHQIAFFMYYRRHPKQGLIIDHINGYKWDNRIVNIREVTQRQNTMNRNPHTNLGIAPSVSDWTRPNT
jgi:hypothetical protein